MNGDNRHQLHRRATMKKMKSKKAKMKIIIPVMFIHGEDDNFILPKNSEDMAKRTVGYKEIHLIKGAGHAESVLTSPEEYKEYVTKYLEELNIL